MNTSTRRQSGRPIRRGASSFRSKNNTSKRYYSGNKSRGSYGGGRRSRPQKSFDVSRYINKNTTEVIEEPETITHTFADFGLSVQLEKAVASLGFAQPSAIQDKAIAPIIEGMDVIGLSNTGTGKTAAFLIPLIERIIRGNDEQVLVLAPTRELAIQIQDELRALAKGLKIYSTVCVGGMSIYPQIRFLRRKNNFIIGTPGRVKDLIARKCINQRDITTVVLDEADRMLDMGFVHDMRKIISGISSDRQTLMFSATMSQSIERLVHDFMTDPITVSVKQRDVTSSIEQDVVRVGGGDKFNTLVELLERNEFSRVLVFGAMKHAVENLSQRLRKEGISSESIHGNKSHSQRQRALKNFKDARARVLVATDVAARGIHVDEVSHVINYDLPTSYEDYVHRIGRTGRGQHKGKALTFVK